EISECSRRPEEAQLHYEAAAQELEVHHARLHHDDLRVTFFKSRHRVYDALVRLALDGPNHDGQLSSAYAWCERARARGLIELLSDHAAASRGQLEQSLVAKINRLREELNTHYVRSQPESRSIRSSAGFETIALKEEELARTLRDVSTVDPEYASLHQVSIAALKSVQAVLPKRTTLIEYFIIGDEVLVFVISAQSVTVMRRVCSANDATGLRERLEFQLETFMLGDDYVAAHAQQMLESAKRHLQTLYRSLIAPFVRELTTPHLVIVPHGFLHFLPFHAFYDGAKYLVDQFEISYAPSASVLKCCLVKEAVPDAPPLLVGVADEQAPMVAEEIAQLRRMFPNANVLQNDTATRQTFVDQSKRCSFLHIAT